MEEQIFRGRNSKVTDSGLPWSYSPAALASLQKDFANEAPYVSVERLHRAVLDIDYAYLSLCKWAKKHTGFALPQNEIDIFEGRLDKKLDRCEYLLKDFEVRFKDNNSSVGIEDLVGSTIGISDLVSSAFDGRDSYEHYIVSLRTELAKYDGQRPWPTDEHVAYCLNMFIGEIDIIMRLIEISVRQYTYKIYTGRIEIDPLMDGNSTVKGVEDSYEMRSMRAFVSDNDNFLDQMEEASLKAKSRPYGFTDKQRVHTGAAINKLSQDIGLKNPRFDDRPLEKCRPNGYINWYGRLACLIGTFAVTALVSLTYDWPTWATLVLGYILDSIAGIVYRGGLFADLSAPPFKPGSVIQVAILNFAIYAYKYITPIEGLIMAIWLTVLLALNHVLSQNSTVNYQYWTYASFAFHFVFVRIHLEYSWFYVLLTSLLVMTASWFFIWAVTYIQVARVSMLAIIPVVDVPALYFALWFLNLILPKSILRFIDVAIWPAILHMGMTLLLNRYGWGSPRGLISATLGIIITNIAMDYMGLSRTQAWLLVMAFEGYKFLGSVSETMGL